MLSGGDGFAVQFLGRYQIPHFYLSTKDIHKALMDEFPKHLSNKARDLADTHAMAIAKRLETQKALMCTNIAISNNTTISDVIQTPVVVENLVQSYLLELNHK